ncbi:hypothetical protein WR25_04313 [Diploscapter pachys]|uniref:Kinesin-like protein n=1 Tax=Diploscapter pachys TaxID=2018661 RepID=A0A2A2JJB8_9BILA|nr:hypothetical protein WR25_04313 [Diploscapter pachys]
MEGATDTTDYFQQCKYIHEVELLNMKLQMRILETHLETKDRLLRNLEDIIDEQEARIANMEDFIQGRSPGYVARNQILKGISVLSLDFGALSEENLRLKAALAQHQKAARMAQLLETDEDYESDFTSCEERSRISTQSSTSNNEKPPYPLMARSIIDDGQLKKLKRVAEELKSEKDELRQLALDTKEAFTICMAELRLMLESKTADFFRVLVERYKAEMEKRRQLHNQLVEINGNIRVFFRIRPMLEAVGEQAIKMDEMDDWAIDVLQPGGKKTSHGADRVLTTTLTQKEIFEEVSPVITSCIDGYNVCIFAYGATGCGKTYTMEGPIEDPGINQRAIIQLFQVANEKQGDTKYSIQLSMVEIYNEKIRDLLNSSLSTVNIRMGEDGRLALPGSTSITVTSAEHVSQVLESGRANKAIACTQANASSSRSHVVVRVAVNGVNSITGESTTGHLNLVDLAGSERVSQTNATGQVLKEAQAINKSLSELGNVVLALRQNQKHIPFRNCQLTRMLEDSLNGDSKTLVIVHLSPESRHVTESTSSIAFAEKISKVATSKLRREGIRKSARKEAPPSPRK